jgi:hypothetical protein
MMQTIQSNSGEMAKNASPVDSVSGTILKAVTSTTPHLRYLVGKDVETWARKQEGYKRYRVP